MLVDWDRRHLYRKLFDDEAAMEDFLATICTMEWNDELDRGRPFADAVADLSARHPGHADRIAAYHERWVEMVAGPMHDVVAILEELRCRAVPLYAVSNWSEEVFRLVRADFAFLDWFDGIVLSSEVGVTKPDRRIFDELTLRYGLDLPRALFIDDSPPNVEGARLAGLEAVQFTSATTLREDLAGRGLL